MNPIAINTLLTQLPEGVAIDDNRQRITAIIGIATSLIVPIPTQPIDEKYREYFYTNFENIRNVLFEINEAANFDIDRAIDYAFCLWKARYMLVFFPTVSDYFRNDNPLNMARRETMPEFNAGVGDNDVVRAIRDIIRAAL